MAAATPQDAVIPFTIVSAERAEQILRSLVPHAQIRVDAHANAVIVVDTPANIDQMRAVAQGIDVKNPLSRTTGMVLMRASVVATA